MVGIVARLMNLKLFRRISLIGIWVGFAAYAFLLAPPDQPDTFALITRLSTGQVTGINPLVVALFNIMGVLPMLYSCFLYSDGRGQRWPAWLFAAGSFALGAFFLLPYLILRSPNPTFVGNKNLFIRFFDSRIFGVFLTLGGSTLLAYGLLQGNWGDFVAQWQTSKFIHVMSLDFCLLCLLFPTLLGDDMARRGIKNPLLFWVVTCLPIVGTGVYLATRPPLTPTPDYA